MENKKFGHFSLFRSLLQTDWAKDTAKMALWVRLLGEASYRVRTVEFANKQWELSNGQLVTTAAILARKLRDQDGKEKSPQAVTRMLNFFIKEGMISTEGNRFGTVITITNYVSYQVVLPDEPSDEPSDKGKASNGAGLRLVADEPSDKPADEQNKTLTNKNKNNKTSTSENSDESSDKPGKKPPVLKPEAAIQSGTKWGNSEDLRCAEWLFDVVQSISSSARKPNYAAWANDIRLMRERDNRTHKEIATLFKWACEDKFWKGNVLCPSTLREKWTQLDIKRTKQITGEAGTAGNKPDLDFNNTDWAYEVMR
ncbi:replication protein [Citrobacter freundii]|uniref:replication protein n=1 Tax=Citrobacter freundii TaxID=546 RepID=UPI0018843529|nr:replication protein [Citrobacter freundii]MBE9976420.1 replication protein [Citrobacter freundii]MBE9985763.1 replication protein [Citrobacter freundii]MBF0065131.1 replication protein [Citrobacter freundii]